MTTKGVLSGWHNVSTNKTMNIDGVSVQDILGIISSIKQKINFLTWKELIDHLFVHISNKENPHQLTPEQLATTVIQLVYEAWLMEGYSGSMTEFVDMLFRYLEYADMTIMNEGVSEEHIPPVNVFAQYIHNHDSDPNAHPAVIDPFFPGNSDVADPVRSFRQIIGVSENDAAYLNDNLTAYEQIPIQDGWMHDAFAFVLSFKFQEFPVFQLISSDGKTVVRIISQPSGGRILFIRGVATSPQDLSDLTMSSDLSLVPGITLDAVAIPNTKETVKCYLMGKEDSLTYGVYARTYDVMFDLNQESIEVSVNSLVDVPTVPRPIQDPKISFAKMDYGDALTDLIYYPQYLSLENITYVIEWIDGNTREMFVPVDPTSPDAPYPITFEPTVPQEPETAPIVYLTAGSAGNLRVSSTGAAWRSIAPMTDLEIVSVVGISDNQLIAASRNGDLFGSSDGSEWNLITTLDQTKINHLTYSDGYFAAVGTYDVYDETSNGTILISRNGEEWLRIWEDWGPAFRQGCFGSHYDMYSKNLMLVVVGDGGRVAYSDIEDIEDFPYDTTVDPGPNGVVDFTSVACGNNKWIAVGSGAQVSSSEGSAWNWSTPIQVGSDPTITWRKILFLNPEFIIIGDGGYVSRSIDGLVWSDPIQVHALADMNESAWNDILSYRDLLVMVGQTGRVTTSEDYDTWTSPVPATTAPLLTVSAFAEKELDKDRLYALDNTNKIYKSFDFVNWVPTEITADKEWYHIAYGNGIFVASGQSGYVAYSEDGQNWSDIFSIAEKGLQHLSFLAGKFYAIDSGGRIYTSTDGRTWTFLSILPSYSAVGYSFRGLAHNGASTLIMAGGNYYFRSTDGGLTWSKITYASGYWVSCVYGNGKFVMVGMAGKVTTSVDGITWTAPATPLGLLLFNDVQFANGKFVATTSTNKIGYSTDGLAWSYTTVGSSSWNLLTVASGKFVVSNASQCCSSDDGVSWGIVSTVGSDVQEALYVNNLFFIIMRSGKIYSGPGLSDLWLVVALGLIVAFRKLIYGFSEYDGYMKPNYVLAVGDNGVYACLEGEYGWTDVYMDYPHNWIGGVYGTAVWIMISSDGAVVVSYDDRPWDWSFDPTVYTGVKWNDICFYSGIYVIVGDDGNILTFDDPRLLPSTPDVVTTKNWIRVREVNGMIVCLSEDGYVMTSTDWPVWNSPIYLGTPNLLDFVYHDGVFLFLDSNGNIIKTDETFTVLSGPTKIGTSIWKHIDKLKQKLVLYGPENTIALSDAGIRWREYSSISSINFMDIVAVPIIILPEGEEGGGSAPS